LPLSCKIRSRRRRWLTSGAYGVCQHLSPELSGIEVYADPAEEVQQGMAQVLVLSEEWWCHPLPIFSSRVIEEALDVWRYGPITKM
jgi:hypothetical protein